MNNSELAAKISRSIFKAGDSGPDKTTRIQFMTGEWPKEKSMGGFNEEVLRRYIEEVLNGVL